MGHRKADRRKLKMWLATLHMTNDQNILTEFDDRIQPKIIIANNEIEPANYVK